MSLHGCHQIKDLSSGIGALKVGTEYLTNVIKSGNLEREDNSRWS